MSALGAHLLERTSLSPEHLSAAEAVQEQRGGALGAILIEEGWLEEPEYLEAAAGYLGLRYREKIERSVSPALLTKVPLALRPTFKNSKSSLKASSANL